MDCKELTTANGCWTKADGTYEPVVIHYTYGTNAAGVELVTAVRYTDAAGNALTIPAGDDVVAGPCPDTTSECVKWSKMVTGIDNTGTSYTEDNTIEVTMSDGSTFTFNQPPVAGWTAQLASWVASMQAAMPDNVVETRYFPNGYPPDGLLAPDSDVFFTQMFARYVNITGVPGGAVPVDAVIIASSNPARVGTHLALEYFITQERRGYVCRACGGGEVLYYTDGTEVPAADIPLKYFSCSEPIPSAPVQTCNSVADTGCDDTGSSDPGDFVPVTRVTTFCEGLLPSVAYYVEDPGDPTALVEYTLVGSFVDCATGAPAPTPAPPCETQEYVGLLYRVSGTNGVRASLWGPAVDGGNAAPHGDVAGIFTDEFTHVNGAPDGTQVFGSFTFTDSSVGGVSGNGQDQVLATAWVYLPEAALLRDVNSNTGERFRVWLDGEAIYQTPTGDDTPLAGVPASAGGNGWPAQAAPCGVHRLTVQMSDTSAFAGMQLQWSFDDGATWANVPAANLFTGLPTTECVPVLRCEDTGALISATDGSGVTLTATDSWCPPCGGSSGGGTVTPETQYATTFDSQFFTSALVVPAAPANTKEVVVFNQSGAWLELGSNYGTQIVPPNGTASWEVNDYEAGITFSSVSIVAGTFSGADRWGINYRAAV